jgi:hypothetical protein
MSKDITVDAYKFDAVFRRMPTKELSATPKASFAIGLTPHDKVDATGGAQVTHCSSSQNRKIQDLDSRTLSCFKVARYEKVGTVRTLQNPSKVVRTVARIDVHFRLITVRNQPHWISIFPSADAAPLFDSEHKMSKYSRSASLLSYSW